MIDLGFAENLGQLTPDVALDKIIEAHDLGERKYVHDWIVHPLKTGCFSEVGFDRTRIQKRESGKNLADQKNLPWNDFPTLLPRQSPTPYPLSYQPLCATAALTS